jgi:hypothetical protein
MDDVVANAKYSCPACGAEAHWNPAKKALVCPYCHTVSPGELQADGSTIRENDLAATLRNLSSESRGWNAERVSVKCQSCEAISVFDPTKVAKRCDFCGSAQLVPYDQIKAPIRPESLLPFQISDTQVRDLVRRWYGSHFFAPNKLKKAALTDTLHGLYVPFWTFDAQVHAEWTAMAGHYYYENESYRDSNGKTQTRRVRKTRWEPAAGTLDHFFDDEMVSGSAGLDAALLGQVEPFPTEKLVPYDAGYLAGWVVEQYQIDLVEGSRQAQTKMDAKLQALCAREVPGDTQRDLQVQADYSQQTFKHLLVPVWLVTYDYGARSFPVLVNGFTGKIAGKYPLSWIKIALVSLAVLIVVLLLMQYVLK